VRGYTQTTSLRTRTLMRWAWARLFFGAERGGGDRIAPRESSLDELQEQIESRLRDLDPGVELERPAAETLRLYIDHPGGVDLALCERVTNHLRDLLEAWSLEVSSPGEDRPLTKPEHFRRFMGHQVRVRTREAIEGQRSFTGRLTAADERRVLIDAGVREVEIPLSGIHRSNLVPDPATQMEGAR
jgi:ribosome maturation factor RimP